MQTPARRSDVPDDEPSRIHDACWRYAGECSLLLAELPRRRDDQRPRCCRRIFRCSSGGLGRRKRCTTPQSGSPAYVYRNDFETPEGVGHMRSLHTIEIPFVFDNIAIAGPLISKMTEAHALAARTSAAWTAFARTGNPNIGTLPQWPAYTAERRDTMLFNTACRVESDPARL